MPKNYSAQYKSTLARVSMEESPLILLRLDHPALDQPIRVVNDTQDLVSNGHTWVGFPFSAVLPDDQENKLSRARISISNVGRDLMHWIESTNGADGTQGTFMQVMRSRPDQIEWHITMTLFNINVNNTEVSAELGFENLFARPAVAINYRPENSPGIF